MRWVRVPSPSRVEEAVGQTWQQREHTWRDEVTAWRGHTNRSCCRKTDSSEQWTQQAVQSDKGRQHNVSSGCSRPCTQVLCHVECRYYYKKEGEVRWGHPIKAPRAVWLRRALLRGQKLGGRNQNTQTVKCTTWIGTCTQQLHSLTQTMLLLWWKSGVSTRKGKCK